MRLRSPYDLEIPGRAAVAPVGWAFVGVWAALDVLIAARRALLGIRFAGRRWAVLGWG